MENFGSWWTFVLHLILNRFMLTSKKEQPYEPEPAQTTKSHRFITAHQSFFFPQKSIFSPHEDAHCFVLFVN